jgi:TonB family protein
LVQALVNENGRVGDLRVIRSLHAELDEVSLDAARQWLFIPGTVRGQPASMVVTMEMTFTLRK